MLGAEIALVHKDTGTDRDIAKDNAIRLVEEEKVGAIVGAPSSGVTVHVARSVTIPRHVVLISPSSTSPDITTLEDDDFVFRTAPSDALQGVILARLARELGFDSASTLYVDNAYGQGLSNKFAEEFTMKGGEVLATVPHVSALEINEPTYVSELRAATDGEPDVLVAISYPESTKVFLRQAILEGLITKFLFVDGNKSSAIIEAIGPRYLNGSFGTAPAFTASTLYVDNAYGQGLSNKFAEEFTMKGGEVLATVPHVSALEINEPTYVSELRAATDGEPDVLVAISYPESTKVFLRQAILEGLITKFLFVDGNKSSAIIEAIGPRYLNGSFGTAPAAVETDSKSVVVDAYEVDYGAVPDNPFFANAYDAVVLLALAIEKAGEAEGPAIRDAIREVANPPGESVGPGPAGLRRALELLRDGVDINYEGAAGPHDFDQFGDVITPIEVWKIQDGKIKIVRHETP